MGRLKCSTSGSAGGDFDVEDEIEMMTESTENKSLECLLAGVVSPLKRQLFTDVSPIDQALLRQTLGFAHYRKSLPRDPEKRRILIDLAFDKARQVDRDSYEKIGPRRRRVTIKTETMESGYGTE
jgi:hypothetical protein